MMDRMTDDDLTVGILRGIRDEIRATNVHLDALRQDTNSRFEELRGDTNRRLDHLAEGQIRLTTEVTELKGDVSELKGDVSELKGDVRELKGDVSELGSRIAKIDDRFEHFLVTGGTAVRDLTSRVARVERHVGLSPE